MNKDVVNGQFTKEEIQIVIKNKLNFTSDQIHIEENKYLFA